LSGRNSVAFSNLLRFPKIPVSALVRRVPPICLPNEGEEEGERERETAITERRRLCGFAILHFGCVSSGEYCFGHFVLSSQFCDYATVSFGHVGGKVTSR